MTFGFAPIPSATAYWLDGATVPAVLLPANIAPIDEEGLCRVALEVRDGLMGDIRASAPKDAVQCSLDGGMVLPTFVDMHTHLDKGHIWPRQNNADGRFDSAIDAIHVDQAHYWEANELRQRINFSLRAAYAHGTSHIRTHLDAPPELLDVSFPVFSELRENWAGRIDLQAVSLSTINRFTDDGYAARLCDVLREHRGILGAVTFMTPEIRPLIEKLFGLAEKYDFNLDFHADETNDPESRSLEIIAEVALARGFQGRVTAGHCCALACQPRDTALKTLDRVAEAGMSIVSLPLCNMFLQGRRPGETPFWRGVTLVHEMRARGIPVAFASDNTRDPFYAYGDLDGLEIFREAVRICQLDCPPGDWIGSVNSVPAGIMDVAPHGKLAPGAPADLVLFQGRTYTELLARPESHRTVLRRGVAIERQLPDYRELDEFVRGRI